MATSLRPMLRQFSFVVPFCRKKSHESAHLPPESGLSEKSLSEMSGGDGGIRTLGTGFTSTTV